MKTENPGKVYSTLKKIGSQPGDCGDDGSFILQNHMDANMTPEQSTGAIANHFSHISQEYPPLNVSSLPVRVQNKLKQPVDPSEIPQVSVEELYEKIKQSKKSKSALPGVHQIYQFLSVKYSRTF